MDAEAALSRMEGMIVTWAAGYAPHDRELREDLSQEARYHIVRRLPEWKPEAGMIATFLGRVAKGAMQHYLRDRTHAIQVPKGVLEKHKKGEDVLIPQVVSLEEVAPLLQDFSLSIIKKLDYAAHCRWVWEHLYLLQDREREELEQWLSGVSVHQIAQEHGVSMQTVYVRQHQAVHKLREYAERDFQQ